MKSLNKVTLIGNLGKDPDVQRLRGDWIVAKLTLATTETYRDSQGNKHSKTEWHNVVLWRVLAELAEKYLRKGMAIYLEGKLQYRTYDDANGQKKYVTEIIGESFIMLDKASKKDE